jgi:hypothetical protein
MKEKETKKQQDQPKRPNFKLRLNAFTKAAPILERLDMDSRKTVLAALAVYLGANS